MAEVINAGNVQIEVPLDKLLMEVMKMRDRGLRFDQACAAYVNEKFELSYSFSDDDAYRFENIRVVIDLDEEVPSVSNIYPAAVFYENEMRELFGVRIEMISFDLHDKLYRLGKDVVYPMLPEAGKKKMAEEMAADKEKAEKEEAETASSDAKENGGEQ
ncbi:MAG: NADH-quinone oxidoreductase subunit C [Lachnospiraceae bacterium]|jgi:NADH:ubiquinone oxidoreductase subunit C|nr:NADH-quinone oxidoreductase subunit C [Lachnospiraceae bacterium]MDD6667131.1 NADH-quinone oxidoreductase subunit C [Lachnospiraceae bacterium]